MWLTFIQWDIAALREINGVWTHPVLDVVMAVASNFSLFKIPLLLGIIALLIWGGFRERLFLVLVLFCVGVGDPVIDGVLKKTVQRPRPHEYLERVRMVDLNETKWSHPSAKPGGKSFPSGHAFNNMAIALLVTVLYGRWGWLLWPWAVLVSYSRVYTGSHHPSDVILSWWLALAYTWLVLKTVEWLWQRYGAHVFPKLYAAHPQLIFKSKKQSLSLAGTQEAQAYPKKK